MEGPLRTKRLDSLASKWKKPVGTKSGALSLAIAGVGEGQPVEGVVDRAPFRYQLLFAFALLLRILSILLLYVFEVKPVCGVDVRFEICKMRFDGIKLRDQYQLILFDVGLRTLGRVLLAP